MIRPVMQVMQQIMQLLRMIAATIGAAATGAVSMATGNAAPDITLAPGDRAPDFTLPASDGRTYRLSDLIGRGETVVIAWFPKAFTGG
jgi:phage-related minor tail protein